VSSSSSTGTDEYEQLVIPSVAEIGRYQDPYSDFGRLSLELLRAARLVVDTGMHAKKWTRYQAIDYLKQNTPNSEGECVDAINRYILMPSQAMAHKSGMLKSSSCSRKQNMSLGQSSTFASSTT